MQNSLRRISEKARQDKGHRFENLYGMLNAESLIDSWKYVNKKAASGVDKVTAKEYQKDLDENVKTLVEDLIRKRYRTKLIRRVEIPKGDGKTRPLGIPATNDKLLQTAVARILTAIYEEDFGSCSFGYRSKLGAKDAIKMLSKELQFGQYRFIVEADIKGFFDNIDHDWLLKMLEQRVNDKAFLWLIKKWLKTGVLNVDGTVINPDTGTPQGGIVSPVLANIYLHYVLDLWFEKVVKKNCRGKAYLCRYADDFVCAFRHKEDADRFYKTLGKRLGKFNLQLAMEKTNIIAFSKYENTHNCFEFLSFEFRWGKSRKGIPIIKRRTSTKKFSRKVREFTDWCKETRQLPVRKKLATVNAKLRGHYNYYGLIGNYKAINQFFYLVKRALFKWLNRRSQRRSYNWEKFELLLRRFDIEKPRITELQKQQLSLGAYYA